MSLMAERGSGKILLTIIVTLSSFWGYGGCCSVCGKEFRAGLSSSGSRDDLCNACDRRSLSRGTYERDEAISRARKELRNDSAIQKNNSSSLKSGLPRFRRYNVKGVVVNPNQELPELQCATRYGDDEFLRIGGMEYYELSVTEYYDRYKGDIPVLGVRGMAKEEWAKDDALVIAVKRLEAEKIAGNVAKKERQKSVRKYKTTIPVLATLPQISESNELVRTWTNKKGKRISGVWIASFVDHGSPGIIVQGVKENRLYKILTAVLADEDAKYVQMEENDSGIKRLQFGSIAVEKTTRLADDYRDAGLKRCERLSFVILGCAKDPKEGECSNYDRLPNALYLLLYPSGLICKFPVKLLAQRSPEIEEGEAPIYHLRTYEFPEMLYGAEKRTDDEVIEGPVSLLAQKVKEKKLEEDLEARRIRHQQEALVRQAEKDRQKAEEERVERERRLEEARKLEEEMRELEVRSGPPAHARERSWR